MKKVYIKPTIFAESFQLVEHIAGGCTYITNFGSNCPITEAGVTFFTNVDTCSEDGVSMMQFKGIDPETATVEDLIGMDIKCYNSFAEFNMLYNS